MPGDTIRYDFKDIPTPQTVPWTYFYWRDDLPPMPAPADHPHGDWDEHLTYSVEYQNKVTDNCRLLEDGLNSKASHAKLLA